MSNSWWQIYVFQNFKYYLHSQVLVWAAKAVRCFSQGHNLSLFRYWSWQISESELVILSSEVTFHEKTVWLSSHIRQSCKCFSLRWANILLHLQQKCFMLLPISSHRILKSCAFKGWHLIQLIFLLLCQGYSYMQLTCAFLLYMAVKTILMTSIVWWPCLILLTH